MSFTKLQYHLVFSTKERRPAIAPELMPRLVPYLGGIIRNLGGQMLAANGTSDHMHVAAILTQKTALMDVLMRIKADSSGWIHSTFPEHRDFAWQDGYSAFSVSESVMPSVCSYAAGQAQHHSKMTFEQELIAMLEAHQIAYDPKYLLG
jgi:REP element-mobilizing transposase RayT